MKYSIKDFFSKCDEIHSFLQIWSHLLKKSVMENFIFLCCEREVVYVKSCAIFYNCHNAKSFLILDFPLWNNYLLKQIMEIGVHW